MKWLLLAPLIAFVVWRWRRGYRDEAAERARQYGETLVIVRQMPSRWDPFYDDDGDGSGGTAA